MRCFALLAFGLAGACSDDDSPEGLSTQEVQDLPAGTARGEELSGEYDVEAYTTSCEGSCGGTAGLYSFTICDIGDREDRSFVVRQVDGRLRVDGDESLFVSRLEGGVDADGTFDVGGYGTESAGSVEATGRMLGDIEGEEVAGVFELWVRGRWDSARIDCRASYEIDGTRRASAEAEDD